MPELEIHHNDPSRFWVSRGPDLCDALVDCVERMRAEYAALLDIVGELDRDGIHRLAGYGSSAQLLSAVARVTPRQARKLIGQAEQVCPTVTPTGHTAPAPLAGTRGALADAAIDGEHVEVIARAMREIPDWVGAQASDEFEHALADRARTTDPVELRACADRMLAVLDQDGPAPQDTPLSEPRNTLSWRRRLDGRVQGRFDLCPVDGAAFEALLAPLAKPRSTADTLDPRTQAERDGDAFAEICALATAAPNLPTEAGERPHLHVTVALQVLESRAGHAILDGAGILSASDARTTACDSKVIPYVLGGASLPLDVGRARYTIPTQMRRALILRDQGCAFPSCDRRPRSCDGHHVRHWADGGPTSLDNLVLLCARHHRLIHNSEWSVAMAADGLPEFTPPIYLAGRNRDSLRTPLRNTVHIRPA